MSRVFANPVRGAVRCPVCSSVSTVHQVGEGKLIAEGEPPKNSRNLGLKYYRCPSCGNSSMSKSVNQYVETHMANDESALLASELEPVDALPPTEPVTEPSALDSVESVELIESAEPSQDKVERIEPTVDSTEQAPLPKPSFFSVKRVLMLLGVLIACVWAVKALMPKPQIQEANHGAK
ncbi:hypothetical protein ACFSJQ_10305 [Vibrio olivae]|uniref:Zinc finger/thioredoxin putative domain-containing protein n=1 Tax=Vibrio olivae TaxID=1243002 RepID=A0ABV5HH00_9VIBR